MAVLSTRHLRLPCNRTSFGTSVVVTVAQLFYSEAGKLGRVVRGLLVIATRVPAHQTARRFEGRSFPPY